MIGMRLNGDLAVFGMVVLLGGCATMVDYSGGMSEPSAAAEVGDVSCAAEAEKLLLPVAVHVRPASDAALLETLERGRFVYRCDQRGAWLAVMYPEPDEPVDCSMRSEAPFCTVGWVNSELRTENFG